MPALADTFVTVIVGALWCIGGIAVVTRILNRKGSQ